MKVMITSPTNPKIKNAVKLRQRKYRKEQGLSLVDGVREFSAAVRAGISFRQVFVCPELLEEKTPDLEKGFETAPEVHEVDRKVFGKIAFGEREEGIVALFAPSPKTLEQIVLTAGLIVVLEDVEKPGNIGAVLRSCDAVKADALLIADETTEIFNPNVIRASIGTIFSVPVVQAPAEAVRDFLKAKDVQIIAAVPQAQGLYTKTDLTAPTAVVMGSEKKGLSDFWQKNADGKVRIPMKGEADSLNISVSTAVLLYEALRQRDHGAA